MLWVPRTIYWHFTKQYSPSPLDQVLNTEDLCVTGQFSQPQGLRTGAAGWCSLKFAWQASDLPVPLMISRYQTDKTWAGTHMGPHPQPGTLSSPFGLRSNFSVSAQRLLSSIPCLILSDCVWDPLVKRGPSLGMVFIWPARIRNGLTISIP